MMMSFPPPSAIKNDIIMHFCGPIVLFPCYSKWLGNETWPGKVNCLNAKWQSDMADAMFIIIEQPSVA